VASPVWVIRTYLARVGVNAAVVNGVPEPSATGCQALPSIDTSIRN
jgi:hypothetical protein